MKKINSKLSSEQKLILFEEGTERPGSSVLNEEKREGSYHCVNCDVKLFDSSSKYESGSGWPSFYDSLPNVFETKTDHHIGYASCLLYTSPSPRDAIPSRMPSSA